MQPALRDQLIAEMVGDPDKAARAEAALARELSDIVVAVYQPWLDNVARRLDETADLLDEAADHDQGECDRGCDALAAAADQLRGLACTLASQHALAQRDTDGALDAANRQIEALEAKLDKLVAAVALALPVLGYVSRGRVHILSSAEPYPDAGARRALAAVEDAL